MDATQPNSPSFLSKRQQGKVTKKTGLEVFFEFFQTHVTTVFDFEKQTGVSRADGCQYKRFLEKRGMLQVVRLGRCPVSGARGVQFVTTDKSKFIKPVQMDLSFTG